MLASGAVGVLGLIGAGSLAAYLVLLAVKYVLCRFVARACPEHVGEEAEVTILQPILSGDPFLETTLRHNLEQAPAGARFLWLVDGDDAEAAQITSELAAESVGRGRVLFCPAITGDLNPKSAKLQQGLEQVQTPYLAVLDDDTLLGEGTLARALHELRASTLYTGLPCYLPGANLWSALVSHFVNNNSILTYLPLLPLVGPLSINGMFYAIRVEELRAMGGFTPIIFYLCDDYALARLVKQHGGTIRQGIAPQFLRTTVPGPAAYFQLLHRWFVFANVLVKDQSLGVAALLFLFLGLPPLLLWLTLLTPLSGPLASVSLAAGLLVRHVALRRLHRDFFGRALGFSWLLSLLAELLQPFHWTHACLQRTIRWRTRRLRLLPDGRFGYLGGRSI